MLKRTFPSPEALRRFPFGLADIALILGTLVLLALIARVGAGTLVSFVPPDPLGWQLGSTRDWHDCCSPWCNSWHPFR